MHRSRVTSRALRSIGYDPDARVLEIEFVSGNVYRYFDVPDALHAGLMTAASHGEYFTAHIRDAGFDYEEVT
ncbi:MAG: KTSC domain-containing protein [Pseudomonadota bacterium]|nr:KTSC domain-containing protein [Pseudomonadota bacterium]